MPEEKPDVQPEEIVEPQDVEEVGSSTTEEVPQPEEATSQDEAVEKEPPFHEHPRFQEVIAEKNELRETVNRLQQQIVEVATSRQSPQDKKDAIDELLVNEEEDTKKWVNNFLRPIINQVVDKAKGEATKPLLDQIERSNAMVGEVIADRFLEKNPDIAKGSPEMQAVTREAAELTRYGMPIKQALEKAKRIVMFDKIGTKAVEKVKAAVKAKTQQKAAANLETTSIPSQALSGKKTNDSGEITMDDFNAVVKEGGYVFGQ